jgi:DNA helicase HerA-like ATPase
MFDKIIFIGNDGCSIKLKEGATLTSNLMNLHLIFEDSTKKILGEVNDLDGDIVKARFLGEVVNGNLIGGTIRKPTLDANIRVIKPEEVPMFMGKDEAGFMELGQSPLYDNTKIYLNVNNFFSNHFAIFGNTGSGKSCGVSRLFQNMFHDKRLNPYKANIFIFDSSGEYYNAFSNLNSINSNFNYRYISTNETDGIGEKLRLPIYLLNKDDMALLLQCTSHSQLPIIERMLKLALVFSQNDMDATAYKNHLIAKAIMTILYTNETAPNKRNEIFSILASCSTEQFNLEAPVQGIGYVRKFRECFLIDNSGNFTESVLMNEYLSSFIKDEYDNYEPHKGVFYTLDTLEKALNFTLISEGWLRNEQTYGDAVTIRVRLHSLIVGENAKYFDVKDYVSLETFLSSLLIDNGKKYQIVNINLNDIDDDFAKVLTKIYSRLIFDFAKGLKNRGSIPFHIILEEAHRYIQDDRDRFLFGYNIFERIAKEGRKYAVILGLISQRPVEISDTVISQCTNFLIFKINHPMDVDYIRKMVPHITDDIIEKQKSLQAGTCLGFGLGFKIPLIVKMQMPDPSPLSSNCDVVRIWGSGIGDKLNNLNNINNNNNISLPSSQSISNSNSVENLMNMAVMKGMSNPNTSSFVVNDISSTNSTQQQTSNNYITNPVNQVSEFPSEEKVVAAPEISNDQPSASVVQTSQSVKSESTPVIQSNINSTSSSLPEVNNSKDIGNTPLDLSGPVITGNLSSPNVALQKNNQQLNVTNMSSGQVSLNNSNSLGISNLALDNDNYGETGDDFA